jgi:flagellar basal-body rod protein FlgB
MLNDLLSAGSIPVLEMTLRFAGRRQEIIAHNIANLDTPNFQPMDVSPAAFQRSLAAAVDARRERRGQGGLRLPETREIRPDGRGGLTLKPRTASGNILFHDRNNRDLERLMQDHAENAAVFRVATELLRSKYLQVHGAIGERVS